MTYPEKNYIVSGLTDGCDDDYYEDIPDPENWNYQFSDGSEIELLPFEDPKVTFPHRRITNWISEDVKNHILEEELDNDQAIHYILTNYKS